MVDEASYVLQVVYDELQKRDPGIVGRLELGEKSLTAYDGQLLLQAELHNDAGYHPSITHCHIIARMGRTSLSDPLDACVMGIDANRQKGLEKAAQNWVTNVGSAIFSLLRARPVMDANHFNGNDPWGVPGCHGFVGPFFGYGMETSPDITPLLNAGLFDYAAAMAPPGIVHLAKVVLEAREGQVWKRTLEIDGHLACFEEKEWECAMPAPTHCIATQFAVFHFADQKEAIDARRRLDDAIRQFVAAVAVTKDVESAAHRLRGNGLDPDIVHRVSTFVPLAFCRVMFHDLGVKFSPNYRRITSEGLGDNLKLLRESAFARAIALYPDFLSGTNVEAVKLLAMYSSTFNVINSALNAGSKPENLVMMPPMIPDPGVADDAIQRALTQLQVPPGATQTSPKPKLPVKMTKPWWKFW